MSFLGVPVLLTDHGGKTGTATVVEAGKLVTYEVHYRLVLVHGVTAAFWRSLGPSLRHVSLSAHTY